MEGLINERHYYEENDHVAFDSTGDRADLHNQLRGSDQDRRPTVLVLTLARFGRWDEVLNEPLPPTDQLFAKAMFHYARGMSYAAKLDLTAAQTELSALTAIAGDPRTKPLDQPQLPGAKLIGLSQHVLAGELAGRRLQNTKMNQHFATAIQLEDALPYMEPPFWHDPVRQIYGAALLEAGRPIDAEKIYREDLKRHPANGWSLYGLLSSLRAQGKTEEAKAVEKRFRDAWRLADITLTASRF